ncbi:uncharacterized protein LOC117654155 [Thrips palmi]|uniref:Uncharacterized protein LOC117654155 n=1 Tax=Thrips palmi TaxID=161013 RepID=A0A6P9ADE1_THRPL|nr:uncharacterized protein LOC117654155 [Thrips palmi]
MQNVSEDEGKHIITASNVNKRLSFRGREKFVEVFCQGRNNYRWAELSQVIATPVDQAISWSSSDEEFDEASSQSQRGRQLPNRTLASHINFGDCKLVRKRGRRHSSAQFVRSIEKRPRERPGKCIDSPLAGRSGECNPTAPSSEMPDSSFERGNSVKGSESIEHQDIWEKNLSILNQTVNLTPDDSVNSNSNEKLDQQQPSPKAAKTASEIEVTSPILVPRVNRICRRRMPDRKELKSAEETAPVSAPTTVPSSPIFKTSKPKWVSVQKLLKTAPSKVGNKSHFERKDLVSLPSRNVVLSNNTSPEAVNESSNVIFVEPTLTSSPTKSNILETPASPVIGRTVKRQKRMIVDKDMSPILGSKDVNRPIKLIKATRSLMNGSMNKSSDVVFDSSFKEDKTVSESSTFDVSLLNDAKFVGEEEESKLLASQYRAAAKRSLDFSFQNKLHMKDIDCDNSVLQTVARQDQNFISCDSVCDSLSKPNWDKSIAQITEEPENTLHPCNLALNRSDLIEDANTEQIDVASVQDKLVKSPLQQKRNKLSLSKKSPLQTCSKKRSGPSIPTASCVAPSFSRKKNAKICTVNKNEQEKACDGIDNVQLSLSVKKHSNQTLLIEDDLSEPMEMNIPDAFGSPTSSHSNDALRNHIASLTDKLFLEVKGPQTEFKNSNNDDVDIDSCSSQSLDTSQQEEIERLPSSSVSTLVAISQASSPPAPCAAPLAAEIVADDFNAPPKKGKTKLKPDGLANRLQRILNRQRSSARIWQFKRSKQSKSSSAGGSEQSASVLISVDKTWTEYSHIVVQGHVLNDDCNNRTTRYLDALSDQVVVILDPTIAEKLEKIMSSSRIRIFPPWQSLKLKGISLILCAYCVEVVRSDCPQGTDNSTLLKKGSECVSGSGLFEIIFPKLVEIQTHLIQYSEELPQDPHENGEHAVTSGSISSLVSRHYVGEATLDILTLTVLRAFQFRPLDTETGQSSDAPSWSLLGQDVAGEVCEVLLGCEQLQASQESIWQGVKTGKVIGKTYCFSGFLPIQRIAPFRVSNLWKIISSMGIEGLCDQPVFYVLSSATLSWSCGLSESQRKASIHQPTFSTLNSILSETSTCEPRRANVFCCILHATRERLYVTDTETTPCVTVITVNQTAFLPTFIFKAAALFVLDLEVTADELRIDKYSRLSSKEDLSDSILSNLVSEEQQRCMARLNPNLPLLHRNTAAKTLATFFGTVVGVDEETAYMWPACGVCENELLSLGDGTEMYRCEKCNNQCDNFNMHMSLQVLCSCANLPLSSSIRLKLHQSTIESMLPPTLCNEEGYDMNTVIGQKLGPLRCEVLHSKDGNFTLQELPKIW